MDGATISIAPSSSPEDTLAFANTGNITGAWDDGTKTLTLSGSDTRENYQAALRSVTLETTSTNFAARTATFRVTDETGQTGTVDRDVSVVPTIGTLPVKWVGPSGGLWNVPSNWEGVRVPDADDIAILAAFVQDSGVQRLEPYLLSALERGARIRLLTGDYLNITQAHALRRVLDLGRGAAGEGGACG